MKSVWIFVAAQVCLALLAMPASTQEFTGNVLHEECLKPTQKAQNFCYGFIIGAIDGLTYGTGLGLAAAKSDPGGGEAARFLFFCTPKGMTNGQQFDVVTNFLDQNPQLRHQSAVDLIQTAMRDAFPCE